MTSTASLLSAGEILKQDSLGRVRTPLGKRQEILAAFDGAGMSAARFAAMVGINYSTFCSWVQERNQKQGQDSVKVPYMAFCVVFVLLAAVFFFIRLPHIGEGKIEPGAGALRYPHVVLGIIGIFMYVGGEVAVGSAIINFLGRPEVAGLGEMDASKFVSLYWGGLLIGRFMGAVELSEMRKAGKQALLVIIPLLAFLFLWFAQSAPLDAMRESSNAQIFALWRERFVQNWPIFRTYLPFIGLCWLLFLFGKSQAGRTLMIFMTTVVVLLLTAILAGGKVAM